LRLPGPLRVAASALEPILALNVEKEVRKDALAIRSSSKGDLPQLLRQARQIDEEFVARLERLPLVRLEIRYEKIEPIRTRRMERLLEAAARILQAPWPGLRPAVRASYGEAQFAIMLREHLQLYAAEVDALNACVRFALLMAPLRERVRRNMEAQANALAHDVTRLLYD